MVHRWSILALLVAVLFAGCNPAPIRIGFLAGLTGSVSELGIGARRALELSIARINRDGGVAGRPLELFALDDANTPAQGLAAYQRFHREGVTAVIGPVASTVIGAVLPYLNENHVLTISPTVSAVAVSGRDDWFFRVITANPAMGEALGQYAIDHGLDRVAVLRETSNDAYTAPILESFQNTLSASQRALGKVVEFDLRQSPDYRRLSDDLGDAPAYLILANAYDTAQVGQKLAQAGRRGPVLGPPWATTPDLIALGGRQAERMVFVSVYDAQSTDPDWLRFRNEYQSSYGEEPGFSAVYAVDALTLLVRALGTHPDATPDELRRALQNTGAVKGVQSVFHLDRFGDVVRDLFLVTVRDGHFVRVVP